MVFAASWSPDGARLATGGLDRTVKVWDAAGGRERLTLAGHMGAVFAASWSPDGARLATGSGDGTTKVWDAAGGRALITLRGHTGAVYTASWSRDGMRLATGSADSMAKVWDATDGRDLLTLAGHTGPVYAASWSPDGARLATGSRDGTAKVWDAAGGRDVATLRGHTGRVNCVIWSSDGTRLATGSTDGTAKVWDPAGGHELLTLRGHAGWVNSVSWSPDAARLATGSTDRTAKVWDAAAAAAVQKWARQDRAVQEFLDGNDFRSPNAKGFLQTWLLLSPLPLAAGESGAQALDRQQLPDEARLRPRPGEGVAIGGQRWVWREHRSPRAVVNFNAVAGRVADRSLVYAVCYVESDRARDSLWLQVGSDDQSKVYLNGRDIYQNRDVRDVSWLNTIGPLGLQRGVNVLLFKVANETGEWGGCLRLVDDTGRPVQGLRVKLTP
jgi:WD40 repeat protein